MPKLHTVFSNKNHPATLSDLTPVGRLCPRCGDNAHLALQFTPESRGSITPTGPTRPTASQARFCIKALASRVINYSTGTNQHLNVTAAWRNGSVWSSYQRGFRLRLWVRVPSWSTVSFLPILGATASPPFTRGLTFQDRVFLVTLAALQRRRLVDQRTTPHAMF